MNLYDVALSGQVTGTFRVIAEDHEQAGQKAQRMYSNGIDHDVNRVEVLWVRPIQIKELNDANL